MGLHGAKGMNLMLELQTKTRSSCEFWRMVALVVHAATGHSWGESAGAIGVGTHLVVNGGNPAGLFRGAIMVCPP